MSEEMYVTDDIKRIFGDNFCGPHIMPHMKEVRVAKIMAEIGSDGMDVEVYCTAMPATFYGVKALPTEDSVGEIRKGFLLTTGSSQLEWAAMTARLISKGMIGAADVSETFGGYMGRGGINQKGGPGNECARTDCKRAPAVGYNRSTGWWYCQKCSDLLNEANKDDAMDMYGGPLVVVHGSGRRA